MSQKPHANTVTKSTVGNKVDQALYKDKLTSAKKDDALSEGGPYANKFADTFKEQPNNIFEQPGTDVNDYRAGRPSVGGRLSIAGKSAGKSGRSGKRAKQSILDAYGALSDKS